MSSPLPRKRRAVLTLLTLSVTVAVLLIGSNADATYPGDTGDNGKIAFTSSNKPKPQIWVMNKTGSNKTQLTGPPRSNYEPSFEWNGDRMVFTSILPNEVAQIFAMNTNGTLRTQITTGNRNWDHASMNAAGTKIVASGYVN